MTPKDKLIQIAENEQKVYEAGAKSQMVHTTGSGSSILLTDSSNYAIEGLKVYGKSTQDGTPTPEAPIPIVSAGASGSVKVKVCGANLFSLGEFQFTSGGSGSGYASAPNEIKEAILSLPNGVYTVVYTPTTIASGATKGSYFGKIAFQDNSSTFLINATNTFEITDDLRENTQNIVLYGYVGNGIVNTVTDFMLNIGSTPLPYEPYTEQTLTLATPNELRAVKEYADYIDLKKGVMVQRCIIGKGANLLLYQELTNTNRYNGQVFSKACLGNGDNRGLCSHTNYSYSNVDSPHYFSSDGGVNIWLPKTIDFDTIKNDIVFIGVLQTPIETPLTAEELAYYKALHTNYPNTTIFNSDGTNMDVSYVADTKLYIDNKFAELSSAIVNNA